MKPGRKIRFDPNLSKGLQDFVILQAFYVIRLFIWLIAHVKEDRMKSIVRVLYRPVSRFNHKVSRRNLAAFFPPSEKSSAQLDELYQTYLEYMVRFQVETARCFSIDPKELEKKVLLDGESHLQETLKKGSGALLVSGHMGTWWHVPFFLAIRGYKVNVVFNSFPARVENYLKQCVSAHGIKMAFVDKGVSGLIRQAARENEIVYLTFDVAVLKHHGNWLRFGHTRININPGPAMLASRHHIPVHYVSTCHGDANRTHANIHPETSANLTNARSHANVLSQQWVNKLHADILHYPGQWWGWGFSDLPLARRHRTAPKSTSG